MVLTGALVNAAATAAGGIVGLFLKKGIPDNIKNGLMAAMGLFVVVIGVQGALKTQNFLIMIISICIGAVLGEIIDIDGKMNKLGDFLQRKLSKGKNSKFSEGFVTCTLLICTGAMAIVGGIEAGTKGDFTTYYAKSVLDCLNVMIFATMFGSGCILSAVVLLLYQGGITLAAKYVAIFLTESMITEMSAVGSLIILAIGFNMLGMTKIKIGNLILATFIPILLCLFM